MDIRPMGLVSGRSGGLAPLSPAFLASRLSRAPLLSVVGTATAATLYARSARTVAAWTINPTSGQLALDGPAQVPLDSGATVVASAFGR